MARVLGGTDRSRVSGIHIAAAGQIHPQSHPQIHPWSAASGWSRPADGGWRER